MAEVAIAPGISQGRPFYSRVTIAGLVLFTLSFVLFLVLALSQGAAADGIASLVIYPVIALVAAGLVLRFGKWVLVASAVYGLLGLALFGPSMMDSLTHLDSFFDFVLNMLVLVGMALTLVGGVVAFIQHRRGTARAASTTTERRVLGGVVLAVAALTIVSGVLTVTGRTTISSEASSGATRIAMESFEFNPAQIEVLSGDTARFVIRNDDLTLHTFTIEELGIDETIQPGHERLVELSSASPGTYEYICDVPGHENMKGTLVVQ